MKKLKLNPALITLFLVTFIGAISFFKHADAVCCQYTIRSYSPVWGGPPPHFTGACTSSTSPTQYGNFAACNQASIAPACNSGCTASGGCTVSASPASASMCPY